MRWVFAVVAVFAAVLGGGHLTGEITGSNALSARITGLTGSSSAAASPPPAVIRVMGPLRAAQEPLDTPITGPGRPPLPPEKAGPYGSRTTSGTASVALTFDDGPDPRWTPQVLELLRQYGVKATFCMIGVNVVSFPDMVRAVAADGHTLCNHSWVHDIGMASRSPESIYNDLARTNKAIRDAVPGARISYYRQPGGAWSPSIIAAATRLGMSSLHWKVDTDDWRRPGARAIAATVTASASPGAIILLHDGGGDRKGTVEALRAILPNLLSRFRLQQLPPGIDPPRMFGIDRPLHPGQE